MTVGKAALVTAGLVGIVALGVMTAPTIRDTWSKANAPAANATPASAPEASAAAPASKASERRVARRATPAAEREMAITPAKKESNVVRTVSVDMWEPELRDRVKKVLNPGSKPEIA